MPQRVRVAVVGLGFGAEFIPIYQAHPVAELAAICQRNPEKLAQVGDQFGVARRFTSFEELLRDPSVDAVHINTPIAAHAPMALAALRAGKHVACTVPMATTVVECLEIVRTARETKRSYMMMETAVYTREFLYAQELVESGKLGTIQFLRGSHQQNMGLPGWPEYWYGMPPMHYATHAVGPLLRLAGTRAESVVCQGSGRIGPDYAERYGSPFAVETALVRLDDSPLACEVTRSLFDTIRQYRESFDVYGTKHSLEWEQTIGEGPVLFSGFEDAERVEVPDYGSRLPKEIARFTRAGVYDEEHEHTSFIQGGGHGGSHPHLVHEFVSAIAEGRAPSVDAETAANWTLTGICAHESALHGGERVTIPRG
ncbi:MAG TPA: Gfo/Idh/MocA family oxidoreductase [Gemmatimonadaceae bacterium]|jgi:predicted dehydrogenase|nr:Gfo/Idh/MocA family oxidoreductase [Gemmatimonadaceae bacterium]